MFKGQKERTVVLPKGDWYDFYTGKYVGNGEKITVTPGLDRIPVYVKDGAILPFMEARLHAPKAGEKVNLEIRHYGKTIPKKPAARESIRDKLKSAQKAQPPHTPKPQKLKGKDMEL